MIQELRFPRWNDILVEIYRSQDRGNYCQKLNRRIRGSLTHVRETVRILADEGMVEITSNEKAKKILLTERGRKVAESIMALRSEMKRC